MLLPWEHSYLPAPHNCMVPSFPRQSELDVGGSNDRVESAFSKQEKKEQRRLQIHLSLPPCSTCRTPESEDLGTCPDDGKHLPPGSKMPVPWPIPEREGGWEWEWKDKNEPAIIALYESHICNTVHLIWKCLSCTLQLHLPSFMSLPIRTAITYLSRWYSSLA